ncbi:hypothetical protein DID76_02030 [Candidatus Marinamargulisbacteria bacterium SCGC AG-414-C22]|nr:hypothetical protein DID76_02030 [Candidatus Marinamargulisbacteria bacterium SCGC AG-414-C22]
MIAKLFWGLNKKQLVFVSLILILIVAWISYLIRDLIPPFLIAFILSYMMTPFLDRIESFFKSRVLSILIMYVLFFSLLIFGMNFLIPLLIREFNDFTVKLPYYISNVQIWSSFVVGNIENEYPFIKDLKWLDSINNHFQPVLLSTAQAIPNFFISTFSTLSYLILIPLIMFFFLLQGKDMKKTFYKIIPNKYFELFVNLSYSIGDQLSNYIRGIFIESLIIGVMTIGMLAAIDSEYTILFGTIAGILNAIPYVGPFIAAIPAVVIYYLKLKTVNAAFIIIIGYLIVQSIDTIIIKPVIFSKSVNLHPLIVFVSLIIGGMIGGIWGLVVAIPILGSLKVSFEILIKTITFRMDLKKKH